MCIFKTGYEVKCAWLWWADPGQKRSNHPLHAYWLPPAGWDRELNEQRQEELVNHVKDSLTSERKIQEKKSQP